MIAQTWNWPLRLFYLLTGAQTVFLVAHLTANHFSIHTLASTILIVILIGFIVYVERDEHFTRQLNKTWAEDAEHALQFSVPIYKQLIDSPDAPVTLSVLDNADGKLTIIISQKRDQR